MPMVWYVYYIGNHTIASTSFNNLIDNKSSQFDDLPLSDHTYNSKTYLNTCIGTCIYTVISKNFIPVFSSFLLLYFIKITNCCLEINHQFSKLFQFMPWKNGCDLMSSAPFKPLPSRSRGLKHNSWNVIRKFIKIKLLFSMLLWKCTCFFLVDYVHF